MGAEEVDGRHEHQPGENAAGKKQPGNSGPDDVAHAEIFRGNVGTDGRAFKPLWLVIRSAWPCAEQILILKKGIDAAQPKAEKHASGKGAPALTRQQHIGARCTFRISEPPMLLDNQLSP